MLDVQHPPRREETADVGPWLRKLRDAIEPALSQADLAEIIGTTSRTILEAEAGRRLPHGLTMVRYLKALGVVSDVPVSLPGLGRLEALEEMHAATEAKRDASNEAWTKNLDLMTKALERLNEKVDRLLPRGAQAKEGNGR